MPKQHNNFSKDLASMEQAYKVITESSNTPSSGIGDDAPYKGGDVHHD
tara:strand:+ start:649 stop:792 length:144 start_codon:yes stop_codon:yes gene_type:complete